MIRHGGRRHPSFQATLRNRSIENRSNDNRFQINWSHSVKLTGYVFLRSPPRPTVDFHFSNSSISTSALPPPASLHPQPLHVPTTKRDYPPPRSSYPPLSLLYFSIRKPSRVTLRLSLSFFSCRQPFRRSSRRLFVFHQANTILGYSSFDSLLFNFH